MKILVLGGTGMLGSKVVQVLKDHEVMFCNSARPWAVEPFDVVVNCAGLVKQREASIEDFIQSNAVLPHQIKMFYPEARIIHISTDCVFSGNDGNYTEDDNPDPTDVYGRSKLLGELPGPALTIRTSVIGHGRGYSLMDWFERQTKCEGWTQAIYTGFPTIVFAKILKEIIEKYPKLEGLYHVASERITKYKLLQIINELYDLGIIIEPRHKGVNRSLDATKFNMTTGFLPSSWYAMINEMWNDRVATMVE